MAYQNFFATATNGRRATPAQTSGKEVSSEFRMRNHGESAQIVKVEGILNDDGTITAHVVVKDPDGNTVLCKSFTCER